MRRTEHVLINGIESKKCTVCKEVKELESFCKKRGTPDGLNHTCRKCANAALVNYRLKNPEKTREKNREQHYKHHQKRVQYGVKWNRERMKIDVNYRVSNSIRGRVRLALKNNQKSGSTLELLGCDIPFLKYYLESMFDENMTWENYGKYWCIDHRRPCANFDLSDPEQQRKCFHYTNLQPLEKRANIAKGSKYPYEVRVSVS